MKTSYMVVLALAFCEHAVGQSEPRQSCPVTQATDTEGFVGNEALKTQAPNSVLVFFPGGPGFVDYDGGLGIKWAWIRIKEGRLSVGGRRLDGEAPPARAYISDGYRNVGFQPIYLVFPTPGCWEITGSVGGSTLTFVAHVEKTGDGPTWKWQKGELPAAGWRVTTHWDEP
jgi:hypothetical protein